MISSESVVGKNLLPRRRKRKKKAKNLLPQKTSMEADQTTERKESLKSGKIKKRRKKSANANTSKVDEENPNGTDDSDEEQSSFAEGRGSSEDEIDAEDQHKLPVDFEGIPLIQFVK